MQNYKYYNFSASEFFKEHMVLDGGYILSENVIKIMCQFAELKCEEQRELLYEKLNNDMSYDLSWARDTLHEHLMNDPEYRIKIET